MAVPITSIKKQQLTEEQLKEQKLDNLKELLSDNEEAVNQVFSIMAELNEKVSAFKLMKMLNDPDVNRALNFGVHFLKGLGKGLKE